MGEERPEISEEKLSSQSGYSPVKQVDPNEITEDVPKLSLVKSKENIPNGKKVSIIANEKSPKKMEDDDSKYELVPPDGGWGWLILFGSMLVNILVPGTIKSFGVLFVEFLDCFEASPSAAAWIPALCYFLYSSLGPLSSILSVKYSYRTVTLIGGTFAAVGMIITYWATSIEYLYFSYGAMVGTGAGLAFPPTVYIVTSYFVRLRGLANGLCISGSALGSIFLPPLLRYLLENYGYRGACLIMGGITLNTWIAALFYEPVERHLKRVLREPNSEDTYVYGAENDRIPEEPEEGDDGKVRPLKAKFVITSDDTPTATPTMDLKASDLFRFKPNGNQFNRSASAVMVENLNKPIDEQRYRKISTPIRNENRNGTFTSIMSSNSTLNAPESMSTLKLNRINTSRLNARPRRTPSTSSFQYMSTPFHGSTLSMMQPKELASHLSLNSLNPVSSCVGSKNKDDDKTIKFIDLSLLRDPKYLIILISNSTNAIGYTNFIILLPSYADTMGFNRDMGAYLLSIVSALDLVGRIGGSALSDMNLMPKTWYFVGGLAISGMSLAFLPFLTSYSWISVCCALFGFSSGTYVGITAVIMADMLGTERLTSSYGISLFVNGLLQLIGPPICGIFYEAILTYGPLFHILGFILLIGAGLWGFMPIIDAKNRRDAQKQEEENERSLLA